MSFNTNSDTVPSPVGLHGRIALALAHATVDSQTRQGVIAYGSTAHESFADRDYVNEIYASTDEWGKLMTHKIPTELAKATAPLNGFRHYMIQDATYLANYYKVNMEAISRSGTFNEVKDFASKLISHAPYVTDAFDNCTSKLGVPKDDVTKEKPSAQLEHSIKMYTEVVRNANEEKGESSWLDIHIAFLPCIVGYDNIAGKLLRDSETIRNTPYFPLWVQAMTGGSSARNYPKFINDNIAKNPAEWEKRKAYWFKIFKDACLAEQAFFGLASPNAFPAYKIVSDGIYAIRSYRRGEPYLVSTPPSSVTTQEVQPQDNGRWKVTNTPDGYTIQNVSQQAFLGVSVKDPLQPVYGAYVSTDAQKWSINAVQVSGESGPFQAYQLLVPNRLQFVLDAGSNASDPKVLVTNNSQISSQLWLFAPVLG